MAITADFYSFSWVQLSVFLSASCTFCHALAAWPTHDPEEILLYFNPINKDVRLSQSYRKELAEKATHKMNKFHLKVSQHSQKVEADLSGSMFEGFLGSSDWVEDVDLKIRPVSLSLSVTVCVCVWVFVKRPVVVWVPVRVKDKSRKVIKQNWLPWRPYCSSDNTGRQSVKCSHTTHTHTHTTHTHTHTHHTHTHSI